MDLITREGGYWVVLHSLSQNIGDGLEENNTSMSTTTFNIAKISKQHPTMIGRFLLYLSICLQQLPLDFDASQLHLSSSVASRMDKYLATVQTLIISDDELVCSIEGLECLVLQGMLHINGGNLRRGWLSFRRALNIGQLMGIHRESSVVPGGRVMWQQIVQADRYLVCRSSFLLCTNSC